MSEAKHDAAVLRDAVKNAMLHMETVGGKEMCEQSTTYSILRRGLAEFEATATAPDEAQRLRDAVAALQSLRNNGLLDDCDCGTEEHPAPERPCCYCKAKAALNGTTPQPRISAEAIAFMKRWAKNSDPVLREGMNLLIEAVEQWAQQPEEKRS